MEPEGSLPHSQVPARLSVYTIRNMIRFYGEGLLAPLPTPKLEDHPLSAVRDCLFNIFAATLHIGGRSSIRNRRTRHAAVTGNHIFVPPGLTLRILRYTHRMLLCLLYGSESTMCLFFCTGLTEWFQLLGGCLVHGMDCIIKYGFSLY